MDRRVEVRIPLQVPVEYRRFGDETYHGLTNDMSIHGICLRSKVPFDVGRRCRLLLGLPYYPEKTEITGEVRWQIFLPTPGRIGIQFSEPIDFPVPFPAADKALRRWRQQTDAYLDDLYQELSEACVWVNARGKIIRYDERFLMLLGYSAAEVQGRHLYDFANPVDQKRLSNLLLLQTNAFSSLTTGLFRMQSKDGQTIFWKIQVPPKQPWTIPMGIYIQDLTEFRVAKNDTYDLEVEGKTYHFPDILGATATGLLIKDVLKEVSNPFTRLVARLDLLRHKLALQGEGLQTADGHELAYYAGEILKIEKLINDLTKNFKYMAEIYSLEPVETNYFDINECISRAIAIVRMYQGFGDETIRFDPQPGVPEIESNEQELGIIFLIFLLLSKHCIKTVSDKTIECRIREDQSHVIASISHNGSVGQDKYLDIIFHNDPIESYFFKSHSVCFMDTLLHYGNFLLKKNRIKVKINSIPGCFAISLFIPSSATN
ncbi:MAG: PilZ domain-containing protein [Desulfobacterales bacterium]|nr:PilZ domain-containing protein [Desulfobacterales bacterium]